MEKLDQKSYYVTQNPCEILKKKSFTETYTKYLNNNPLKEFDNLDGNEKEWMEELLRNLTEDSYQKSRNDLQKKRCYCKKIKSQGPGRVSKRRLNLNGIIKMKKRVVEKKGYEKECHVGPLERIDLGFEGGLDLCEIEQSPLSELSNNNNKIGSPEFFTKLGLQMYPRLMEGMKMAGAETLDLIKAKETRMNRLPVKIKETILTCDKTMQTKETTTLETNKTNSQEILRSNETKTYNFRKETLMKHKLLSNIKPRRQKTLNRALKNKQSANDVEIVFEAALPELATETTSTDLTNETETKQRVFTNGTETMVKNDEENKFQLRPVIRLHNILRPVIEKQVQKEDFMDFLKLKPACDEVPPEKKSEFSHSIRYSHLIPFSSELGKLLTDKDRYKMTEENLDRKTSKLNYYLNVQPMPPPPETEYKETCVEESHPCDHLYNFPSKKSSGNKGYIRSMEETFCKPMSVRVERANIDEFYCNKYKCKRCSVVLEKPEQ